MTPEALISTRFLTMGYHAFDVPVRTRITINICGDLKKKKVKRDSMIGHHHTISEYLRLSSESLGH